VADRSEPLMTRAIGIFTCCHSVVTTTTSGLRSHSPDSEGWRLDLLITNPIPTVVARSLSAVRTGTRSRRR
jgi:hypothetical protein